jgi:N-acetylmuramoyl-L-alanine amidase
VSNTSINRTQHQCRIPWRVHYLTILLIFPFFLQATIPAPENPFTIVIDAGHGGHDPGCLGSTSKEKEICLNVALSLGTKLKKLHSNINIVFTRDKDEFIPLKDRAALANKNDADLFISLHCNYAQNKPHVCGAESYVMGLHKTAQNMTVAKRENAVINLEKDKNLYDDFSAESPIGHIILQNRQTANLEHSIRVASLIQTQLNENLKRNDRGVKQAGFIVLYYTTMPSVLVEMGFLSHSEEEAYLLSKKGTDEMSEALTAAISQYYKETHNNQDKTKLAANTKQEQEAKRFKIQIAASRNSQIKPSGNGPWNHVDNYEVIQENGLFKYLTGNFLSLSDAISEKERLRDIGFHGAFIVAYVDEVRISIGSE